MSTRRIFISTVSNEFKKCRERLAADLRFPTVDVQTQEENISQLAAGQTILIKLDDYIAQCDAVIHLIGQQTSIDGSPAETDAVDDLLAHYPDFAAIVGLTEAELRTLSYTQWEAWLAFYHRKTKRPELKLILATPTDAFVPDHPPHAPTALAQADSQTLHAAKLRKRSRWPEIEFADEKDLSIAILRALKDILPAAIEQKIAPTRLVSRHTGPESTGEFLGRENELKLLDEAWDSTSTANGEPRTANVLSIIAWGGVGKTALLAEWIDRRFVQRAWKDDAGQPDPLYYFDWTFYDQGTRSDDATHAGAASVDSFFDTALRFFGDPEPHLPGKGARLAALIQKQRTLLVLDGLEPLQYPPNHPQAGQITDPDLHALLANLAQRNPGLCVLTSRQALTGLRRVDRHDLDELPEAIAIRLLQKLGVIGSPADLAAAVRDYFGHALSLIVLGRFLFVKGGDIRLRDTIKLERANERRPETTTRNAWHVLEAYEHWLASPEGRAEEVQALRLTGLFDRPASPDCLDALRRAPAIPGLTDHLVPLDDDAWNAVLHRLHEAHLIQLRYPPREPTSLAPRPEARQVPLDAHPLIREYFAKQLRDKHQAGYQQAHSRLFDHLCKKTEYRPDTLERLQPLYQAVGHGCRCGYQVKALLIYRERILRRGEDAPRSYFSTNILGAISEDLGLVSAFFSRSGWQILLPGFHPIDQAWILNQTAFLLRAVGRLQESVSPMTEARNVRERLRRFNAAAGSANNLCEIYSVLGELQKAIDAGNKAVQITKSATDEFQRVSTVSTLAYQFFLKGDLGQASLCFEKAKVHQEIWKPEHPLLGSLGAFRYGEFRLHSVEAWAWRFLLGCNPPQQPPDLQVLPEISSLIETPLVPTRSGGAELLITRALYSVLKSKVAMFRRIAEAPSHDKTVSDSKLMREASYACEALRAANQLQFAPCGQLHAGFASFFLGESVQAKELLCEAQQIAERGPMPLHLADVHLHRARLAGSVKDEGRRRKDWPGVDPHAELKKARALIEQHSYWRRKEELEDAEAAAVHW